MWHSRTAMQWEPSAFLDPLIDTAHMNIDDISVRLAETIRFLFASRIYNDNNQITVCRYNLMSTLFTT